MSLPDGERISDWIVDEMVALGASTTAPGSKLREHSDAIGQGVENEMLLERTWVTAQIAAMQIQITQAIDAVNAKVDGFDGRIDALEVATGLKDPYVGLVMPDGIVAGQAGGQWFIIAFGSSRYQFLTHSDSETYVGGIGYSLPNEDQLLAIYSNQGAIDAADSSGLSLSDVVRAWSSQEFDEFNAYALDFTTGAYELVISSSTNTALPVKPFTI